MDDGVNNLDRASSCNEAKSRTENLIRVLLVDDDEFFRANLAALLANQPQIRIVCQCDSLSRATSVAKGSKLDVVIMSDHMPDCSPVDAVKAIADAASQAKVALFGLPRQGAEPTAAVNAGAHGYLSSSISSGDLIKSVELIHRGGIVISSAFAAQIVGPSTHGADEKTRGGEGLSPRQTEVARLVAAGATNHEIAQELIVAESTVKMHLKNILDALRLRNRTQLTAWATASGLTTDDRGRD